MVVGSWRQSGGRPTDPTGAAAVLVDSLAPPMGGVCVRCVYARSADVSLGARLDGLVACITGVTAGGLGFEIASTLAQRGAHIILAGRSNARLTGAIDAIVSRVCGDDGSLSSESELRSRLTPLEVDVSDLASVDRFVRAFSALEMPLNLLVHNAGIMFPNGESHAASAQGIELTMATNYVGAFLLTKRLLPHLLRASADQRARFGEHGYVSRVIHMSSVAHRASELPQHVSRLETFFRPRPEYYDAWSAYAHSKLCQVLHSRELARRYDGATQLQAFSCHPGVVGTAIGSGSWWIRLVCLACTPCFRTPSQGAATPTLLALARDLADRSGEYFVDLRPRALDASIRDPDLDSAVWDHTETIIRQWESEPPIAEAARTATSLTAMMVDADTVPPLAHEESREYDRLLHAAETNRSHSATKG